MRETSMSLIYGEGNPALNRLNTETISLPEH